MPWGGLTVYNLSHRTIWVAGHKGLVGSALLRRLEREHARVLTVDHADLDLCQQSDVEDFVAEARPDAIIIAAAKVGGIQANMRQPVAFLTDNLAINLNIARAAHRSGVDRVMFLGSSCIYPRLAEQPIAETALLTGDLEPTNQWYAMAKIAAVKLAQAYREEFGRDYISVMPTNLYGPGDNFDLETSHVVPALLRKAHEARLSRSPALPMWGTGKARREFLHVDDCADALVFALKHYSHALPLNIGTGQDIALIDLARMICDITGFAGSIAYDASKPDGTPRKRLDTSRLNALGWKPRIGLREGLISTYAWYCSTLGLGAAA